MKSKKKLRQFPKLKSDKEAEDFVSDADLTVYDFSAFRPMQFEFAPKTARINMRLPDSLLKRIKEVASEKDIPYTRYIRLILEASVERKQRKS